MTKSEFARRYFIALRPNAVPAADYPSWEPDFQMITSVKDD